MLEIWFHHFLLTLSDYLILNTKHEPYGRNLNQVRLCYRELIVDCTAPSGSWLNFTVCRLPPKLIQTKTVTDTTIRLLQENNKQLVILWEWYVKLEFLSWIQTACNICSIMVITKIVQLNTLLLFFVNCKWKIFNAWRIEHALEW